MKSSELSYSRPALRGLALAALLLLAAGCEPGVSFESTQRTDRFTHGVRLSSRCEGSNDLGDTAGVSGDGKWLAHTEGEQDLEIVDARSCQRRALLKIFTGAPGAYHQPVALSTDGTYVAIGQHNTWNSSHPRLIELWSVATKKRLARFAGHKENVKALAVSPRGRWVASIDKEHALKLWSMQSGKLAHSGNLAQASFKPAHRGLTTQCPPLLAFSPDGEKLAVGACNEAIKLFVVKSGALRAFLGRPVVGVGVTSFAFSGDGKQLAAGWSDDHLTLFQIAPPKLLRSLAVGQALQRRHPVGGTLDQFGRLFFNSWRPISTVGFDRQTRRFWGHRPATEHLIWIEAKAAR